MPELPDITIYVEALRRRILPGPLVRIRISNPFLLRSVAPSPEELDGRRVREVRRLGKRIVIGFEGDDFAVLHLMIAGRLQWAKAAGARPPGRIGLAAFDFPAGTLIVTEAGSKRRASLHLVHGEAELGQFDRGGIEPLTATLETFAAALRRENHTLKRALTDQRLIAGVGNAYSDEILHRARLSPVKLTSRLTAPEIERLHAACQATLVEWTERLRTETGEGFPKKVTAFRRGMAVHGRYREPCPACRTQVARITYADHETNYCPRCQAGGKLLADRGLSRLLRGDWPRTLEEMEERMGGGRS